MNNIYELSMIYNDINNDIHDTSCDDWEERYINIQDNFKDKSINTASIILNLQLESEKILLAEERLKKKRISYERKIERLKNHIINNMRELNLKDIPSYDGTFKIRLNDGRTSINILDENKIGDKYCSYEKQISKTLIRTAIDNGEYVEGVEITRRPFITIT